MENKKMMNLYNVLHIKKGKETNFVDSNGKSHKIRGYHEKSDVLVIFQIDNQKYICNYKGDNERLPYENIKYFHTMSMTFDLNDVEISKIYAKLMFTEDGVILRENIDSEINKHTKSIENWNEKGIIINDDYEFKHFGKNIGFRFTSY